MIRSAVTILAAGLALALPAVAAAQGISPEDAPPHDASPPSTIVVRASSTHRTIPPAVFGSTLLAPESGMGAYDDAHGRFWPSFLRDVTRNVYVGSLRFPGGISAESYHWERAIGPQAGRVDQPIAPANGASDSAVGPDEFGQLLDVTGAMGVVTVNFATGSPAEAAAFVQYMTGAPGSSPWADRRVADGHPAPYDVPWWEVGNEEDVSPYWALDPPVAVGGAPAACRDAETCLYIYGGTTRVTGQRLVTGDDRRQAAGVSLGTPRMQYEVSYPPVVPGTATVTVGGVPWTPVTSLATAAPADAVYTLNPTTGVVTFGDGVHGAIPPLGEILAASYDSGPHSGFDDFYAAMKEANPAIHVCASDTSARFIQAMGHREPYDCLQAHPYISPRTLSSTEPIRAYERKVMGDPYLESEAVQMRGAEASVNAGRHIPLVLTEYGQLVSSTPDPLQEPYFLSSLDEALLNASQLADWIRLGVPVADRQLLDAELPPANQTTVSLRHIAPFSAGGAIVTDGARTIVEPTGQMLALMRPLAGERRLGISVTRDPRLTTVEGRMIGDLSVLAGTGRGAIDLVAINRSPADAVRSQILLAGFSGTGRARLQRLDGPSALSVNAAGAPRQVRIRGGHTEVRNGRLLLTLPAHSITRVSVSGL